MDLGTFCRKKQFFQLQTLENIKLLFIISEKVISAFIHFVHVDYFYMGVTLMSAL